MLHYQIIKYHRLYFSLICSFIVLWMIIFHNKNWVVTWNFNQFFERLKSTSKYTQGIKCLQIILPRNCLFKLIKFAFKYFSKFGRKFKSNQIKFKDQEQKLYMAREFDHLSRHYSRHCRRFQSILWVCITS